MVAAGMVQMHRRPGAPGLESVAIFVRTTVSPDPAEAGPSPSGVPPPRKLEHLPTLTKSMDRQQNQKTVITVMGARPQFVKAGPVSPALQQEGLCEIMV